MIEFFSLIWTIMLTAVSEWFMSSDLSLLIYLAIISIVFCYFSNLIRDLRKF